MTFWGLVQVFVDLVLLTSAGFMWVKLHRPAKDDPRMSRGLQLLQSKISVLEDLSDRTEVQVTQLTTLMEQKCRDIQGIILQAEKQIQKVEAAMGKSLEVAKIFQDKIPHQEIIERQNTIKYVKAARMAHQGASIEDIVAQVDLSRGEIEFIAKVNREQLQFSEADLPEWVKEESKGQAQSGGMTDLESFIEPIIQKPAVPFVQEKQGIQRHHPADQALSDLGNQFRQAMQPQMPQTFVPSNPVSSPTPSVQAPSAAPVPASSTTPAANAANTLKKNFQSASSAGDPTVVRKVVFPKIEANQF